MNLSTFVMVFWGVILSAVAMRIGYVRMKKMKEADADADARAAEACGEAVKLGKVTYQGGLRDQLFTCHMYLYVTAEAVVVYGEAGYAFSLPFEKCQAIDFFILRQKQHSPFKSVVLLGPFAPMLFKDRYRHMAAFNYTDETGLENNLLLEADGYARYCEIRAAIETARAGWRVLPGTGSVQAAVMEAAPAH